MGSESPQRGQTLVEFALGAILLFTVVFGIVEFGRLIYAFSAVHNAAREGARHAAVDPLNTDKVAEAAQRLAVGVPVTVDYTPDLTDPHVHVEVSHEFDGILLPDIPIRAGAHQFREVVGSGG